MSKSVHRDGEPVDHTAVVDWVAISQSHGTARRLHKVAPGTDTDELQIGDEIDAACHTTLVGKDSSWSAKPANVYPAGYHPLCTEASCFGDELDDAVDATVEPGQ